MENSLILKILLAGIFILALTLRIYKIDSVPPSISWDEAAVGYNGWSIANFGKDEYGKFLPLFFRSFADDKHPVHIYFTALSVKLLGLSEFSTRLPAALFGILNVLLIFFLAKIMFKSEFLGSIAAFFLAISPYSIYFSRFNHEVEFALFFLLLGLILFYKSFEKNYLLPLSILSFVITFVTYHPAKIIVPVLLTALLILYPKKVLKNKKGIFAACVIALVFVLLILLNPELLGLARINQTSLPSNGFIDRIKLTAIQYSWHFMPQFLFLTGDKNPRLSSQTGEFYKMDAVFLLLGLFYLLCKRSRESIFLLTWALVAPLPSALVAEAPHAARAMYMMGSWHLISALGFYFLVTAFRKPVVIKWIIVTVSLIILLFSLSSYLDYYYGEYAKRYAIEWQYGMKQIVEYVQNHPEYEQVFMTDARSQPYIFFLYYLKTPLPDFLNSVIYNNMENKTYNTVAGFDGYYFGGWDPIESFPQNNRLYIVTPSQYDGLRHKALFNVKKKISYPNGRDAFYLVSIN